VYQLLELEGLDHGLYQKKYCNLRSIASQNYNRITHRRGGLDIAQV
jgi:hypothetical protein